mmetsp:Transcript_4932/g.10487  ORF Transcript_4932/g.10487 Transcript_4932/m.10487 type:complete len:123 (-) Transcript_4932:528-896(-)
MLTDSVSRVEELERLAGVDFFEKGRFVNGRGADEHELNEEWRMVGDAEDRGAGPLAATWVGLSPSELFRLSSRAATKEGGSESLASEMDRRSERLPFSVVALLSSDGAPISFALDERRFGCG